MIKKTILMLLVLVGGVMTVNASTRIYVKLDANWMQYCGGTTKLYIWTPGTGGNADTKYTNDFPGDEITLIHGSYGTWGVGLGYVDITAELPSTNVKFIINKGNSDWQTGDCEGVLADKTTLFWYSSSGSNNTYVSVLPDEYYLVSWTNDDTNRTATKVTLSNNSFSADIDAPTEDTFYCIAPAYALTNDKKNIDLWNETYLPKTGGSNYEINAFFPYSDDLEKSNSYCWKFTNGLKTKSTFTANLSTLKFSITPYFERTITGVAYESKYYATFSSAYNVAIPEGVTAYYANTTADDKVTMTAFTKGIRSTDGAFLRLPESGSYKFSAVTTTDSPATNYLKPSNDGSAPAGSYVFARQNGAVGFFKVSNGLSSGLADKAYLELPSTTPNTAPSLDIEFDDGETTGIYKIEAGDFEETSENSQMYDLQGRRVAEPAKGVYIVNGKKVIIK